MSIFDGHSPEMTDWYLQHSRRPRVHRAIYEGVRKSVVPAGDYLIQHGDPAKVKLQFEDCYRVYTFEGFCGGSGLIHNLKHPKPDTHAEYHLLTTDDGMVAGFYVFARERYKNQRDPRGIPMLTFFYVIPSQRRRGWFRRAYVSLTKRHGSFVIDTPNTAMSAVAKRCGHDPRAAHKAVTVPTEPVTDASGTSTNTHGS